jgi:3-isopropylmalate dehydrogenase
MLRFSFDREEEAVAIEKAVRRVLEEGYRTPDLMEAGLKLLGTAEMGDLVAEYINV